MSNRYPFGANTLIIPFTFVGGSMNRRRSSATGGVASELDVTPFDGPITPSSPYPYAIGSVGGTTVRLGSITLPVQTEVTADQLRAIMPHAGAAADQYAEALNQAMAAEGINTPQQRAAFLA